MNEWALVIFTLAIELSCGMALTATLFDARVRQSGGAVMRPVGLTIFPLTAFGLMVSLLHLGHPLSAWRSLLNLGSSRLSLEVLLTALFAFATLVYSYSWWKDNKKYRLHFGVATSVLGLAAVVSSATIYLVPAQPGWNSGWVPVSFLGTTLLLGGFATLSLVNLKDRPSQARAFLAMGIAGSLALVFSAIWMLACLSRVPHNDFDCARLQDALHLLLTSQYSVGLGAYLILTGILPTSFAFRLWPGKRDSDEFSREPFVPPAVFIAVAFGAIIGRTLMYLLGTSLPPF